MKLFITLALVAVAAQAACRVGYYGDNCNNACSTGCGDEGCNADGTCTASACETGWSGEKCETPKCFSDGCAYDGKCVAPNYCTCGKAGAQVVGIERDFDGIVGTNCVSLRRDGIMGAGIALVVMACSITTCGFIANSKSGKKNL